MATILIIDDDDAFRTMLRRMLQKAGYQVIDAANGDEGLRMYKENPADLVITDIYMPEKEGVETIIELVREFSDPKIIAISGGGKTSDFRYLEYAKRMGAARALKKPFRMELLLQSVQDVLAG